MPRRSIDGQYPKDWQEIARRVKDEANWRCIRCNHGNDLQNGYVLTVHHLDMNPANNKWWNIVCLCQRCHLKVQAKLNPDRPYSLEHSGWYKPYVAGFYAMKYLGQEISRKEAVKRLDELLALEHTMTQGVLL